MFDTIAPRYELMNRLMTLGLDAAWRRATVRALLVPPGCTVLDLAGGTGDLARELRRFGITPVSADLSIEMLRAGGEAGAVQADGSRLPFSAGAFDGVVCGFALRNFTDLSATLAEAGRVVRPGGRVALLEVDRPSLPLLSSGHRWWMDHVVPALGRVVSDPAAYRYLPRSLAYLPAPGELSAMLSDAGFVRSARRRLSGGIVQVVTATRSGAEPIRARPGPAQ